jgi:1-deoxy-D-xylulose-5-phosphate reductoisomerase
MNTGGNIPTIYNAANERAVALFLEEKIPFLRIPELISEAMMEVDYIPNPNLDDILATEQLTYEYINRNLNL